MMKVRISTVTKSAGFTLTELVIVMAIIGILAAVGTPSFLNTLRGNQMATTANELISAMHLARSEAVKRSRTVTVCASAGAGCAGSTDWGTGWIVIDPDNNVLRRWESVDGDLTLTGSNNAINYRSTGTVDAAATFELRAAGGCAANQGRDISISVVGRPSVTRTNC
jgi:type IV fimbrial biogenesis protein FimT